MCVVFKVAVSSFLLVSKSFALLVLHTGVSTLENIIPLGEEVFDASSG